MPPVVVEQLKATNNDRTLTPAWNTMIPIDALENHSPVNIKAEAGLTIASETVASPKLPEPADLGQNLEMKSKTFNKEEQRNIVSSTNYQTCPTCNKVYIPSFTFLSFYLIFFYNKNPGVGDQGRAQFSGKLAARQSGKQPQYLNSGTGSDDVNNDASFNAIWKWLP